MMLTGMMRLPRRKHLLLTTAAALSTSLSGSYTNAFVVGPRPAGLSSTTSRSFSLPSSRRLLPVDSRHHQLFRSQQTRLFSQKDDGILSKIGNAVKTVGKSILPASWFQSEEERKAVVKRQRAKDEFEGGMKELLKDAPLPIRAIGGMLSPLMGNMMSGLAESMAEQQETVDSLLDDARSFIATDDVAVRALGDPVQVGAPMQQSSSTSIINGKSTTRVELTFPVKGGVGSGVARLSATEEGIKRLELETPDGRAINVSLSKKKRRASSLSTSSKDDDVIEAEIIEKEPRP